MATTCNAALAITMENIPRGQIILRTLPNQSHHNYYCYVPHSAPEHASLFVTVHGISRNALEHAELFAPYADRHGVVLVAPCFSKAHFPDYQRLGVVGKGERADLVLRKIVDEVAMLTGARGDAIFMFGFSGGAQFAHRYAMAYPEHVARLIVGAAGWYTFPDPNIKYPRGTRATKRIAELTFDPQRFLAVPICAVVGERDIKKDKALKISIAIEQQQGATRLERGQQWIAAMSHAAQQHRIASSHSFKTLPKTRHSFSQAMKRGGMGDCVFNYLFGDAT